MATAAERILSRLEENKKDMEGVKLDLAKQLAKACETHNLLTQIGAKNILQEPQFAEYVEILFPKDQAELTLGSSGQKKNKGKDITAAIFKVLEGGSLGASEIHAKIEEAKILPLPLGPIASKLKAMVEAKELKSTGEGKSRKYSLPK